jgi:hypothetical protein
MQSIAAPTRAGSRLCVRCGERKAALKRPKTLEQVSLAGLALSILLFFYASSVVPAHGLVVAYRSFISVHRIAIVLGSRYRKKMYHLCIHEAFAKLFDAVNCDVPPKSVRFLYMRMHCITFLFLADKFFVFIIW